MDLVQAVLSLAEQEPEIKVIELTVVGLPASVSPVHGRNS